MESKIDAGARSQIGKVVRRPDARRRGCEDRSRMAAGMLVLSVGILAFCKKFAAIFLQD